MAPETVAKYVVAFGRQYEMLEPGTVAYRGALIANRKVLNALMRDFDGSADEAEVIAELRGLLLQAAKLHRAAGGLPVALPGLEGLGMRASNDGMGFFPGYGWLMSRLRRRRSRRRARREDRQASIEQGTASPEEVREERQDRIVSGLRRARKRFGERAEARMARRDRIRGRILGRAQRRVRRRQERLALRAKQGGFGSRLARGLLRLGKKAQARRQRRRARREERRQRRRARRRRRWRR